MSRLRSTSSIETTWPSSSTPTGTGSHNDSSAALACGHGTELVPASGSRRTNVTVPREASAGSRVTRSSRSPIDAASRSRRASRSSIDPPDAHADRGHLAGRHAAQPPERHGRQAGVDPPAPEPAPQPPFLQRPGQQPARGRRRQHPREDKRHQARRGHRPDRTGQQPPRQQHAHEQCQLDLPAPKRPDDADRERGPAGPRPRAGTDRGHRAAAVVRLAARRPPLCFAPRTLAHTPELALLRRVEHAHALQALQRAHQRHQLTGGLVAAAAGVTRAVEQIVDRHHDRATTRLAAAGGPQASAGFCSSSASRSARSAVAIRPAASRSSASGAP